jgi:hypothetical protein
MIDLTIGELIATATELNITTSVRPGTETVVVTSGLPKIVYTRIDTTRRYADQGQLNPKRAVFQIDIFATTLGAAGALASLITRPATINGLDGYSVGNIKRIWFDNDRHGRSDIPTGQNKASSRYILDLMVEYRE